MVQNRYFCPNTTLDELMVKYHIRKVAVATNFSVEADNAVLQAASIANQHNASLEIIHAVSPSESRNKKAAYVSDAYTRLKSYAEAIKSKYNVNSKVYARVSDVTDFIYKYCVDKSIDLLVIGIQPGSKKYLGMPTAYDIIMKIECPVLTIPTGFDRLPFQRILFPVRDVAGVEDKLLYTKPFSAGNSIQMICLGEAGIEKIRDLTEMASRLGIVFQNIGDDHSYSKVDPSHVIYNAKQENDDLIVINATKEKEWYNIFGDNYTAHILKEADVPVLSITHRFESKE